MLYGIVYKVINKVNNNCYIGQTIKTLKERKRHHYKDAHISKGNVYFHNALKKYNEESFNWSILEHCDSKEELDEMEFHYIKQFDYILTHDSYLLETYPDKASM